MELVYLWVEDYKNIKNQGFNFSPRFTCSYDKDSKELTIEKKEHVNIFPNNINITAIVGENGSGKSSILESLQDVLSENFSKWLDEDKLIKCIVIYKHHSNYTYLEKNMKDTKIINKKRQSTDWIQKNSNDRLLESHSDILTLILQNEVNPKTIFKEDKQIFIEQTQTIDKNRVKKYIVMNTINSATFKEESKKFFNPDKVSIKIKWHNIFNQKDDSDKYGEGVLKEIQLKVDEAKQNLKDKKYKDCFYTIFKICKIKQSKFNFTIKGNDYINKYFEAEENYSCLSKIVANQPLELVHKSTIDKLDDFENMIIDIDKLDDSILDFIFDLPEFIFDIEIKDNDKSFDDLSFGERQLLTQLNCILFYANKKQYVQYEGIDYFKDEDGNNHEVDVDYEKKVKSMLVLLDEFEVGLHPNWQKKSLNYVVDFLQNIKGVDFNLIFTSHSPFILSDLPKENVIFLEKYKKDDIEVKSSIQKIGNCKNVTNETNIDTFGANIHTLLSHGFFMKDGLMGEFAKEKINDVYYFLTNEQTNIKTKEEAQNIINLIGEPLIKKQLQELYNQKNNEKSKDEIIEELKKRVEELEKSQK